MAGRALAVITVADVFSVLDMSIIWFSLITLFFSVTRRRGGVMQEHRGYKHTLVATLGGQPQIVTFTLDLLLRRGISIYEVIIVHPASSPSIQQSLARLNAEFVGDRYTFEGQNLTIRFRKQ